MKNITQTSMACDKKDYDCSKRQNIIKTLKANRLAFAIVYIFVSVCNV